MAEATMPSGLTTPKPDDWSMKLCRGSRKGRRNHMKRHETTWTGAGRIAILEKDTLSQGAMIHTLVIFIAKPKKQIQ